MDAIIVNNKIILVEDTDLIVMQIICPAANIQKMIEITNCSVLSKVEHNLYVRNYAGLVYSVRIRVVYEKIKQFLERKYCYDAYNAEDYLNLLVNKNFCGLNQIYLRYDNVKLYAFGVCYSQNFRDMNQSYFSSKGHKIS